MTGYNSIQIALNSNKREFYKLIIKDNCESKNPKFLNILNLANKKEIPLSYMNQEQMNNISRTEIYQNILLKCSPIPYFLIKGLNDLKFLKPKGNVVLFLDQITDPQNFGSILRNAFFFGADFVIADIKSKPPLNGTISKTSSGALELMNILVTDKSIDLLKELKQNNFNILCLDLNKSDLYEKSNDLNNYEFNSEKNYLIILGNEGIGINNKYKEISKENIYIKDCKLVNKYPFSLVDSLNVSNSSSILLNKIKFSINKNN